MRSATVGINRARRWYDREAPVTKTFGIALVAPVGDYLARKRAVLSPPIPVSNPVSQTGSTGIQLHGEKKSNLFVSSFGRPRSLFMCYFGDFLD